MKTSANGRKIIGWTDGPVGEFLPTSADKPITVGGRAVESKKEYSGEFSPKKNISVGSRVVASADKKSVPGGRMKKCRI